MSSALTWQKVSPYCIQSGRYLVAKVVLSGEPWFLLHAGDERLGMWRDDPNAAKQAAQAHSHGASS